jgi:multiple sugar transport system ATP-binding protein
MGDAVTLGLRPEDIGIHVQGGEDGIPGEVHVVEPLGSETLVNVKTSVGSVKVKVFHDTDLAPGDMVRLIANPARVRLFDQAGMAIGR